MTALLPGSAATREVGYFAAAPDELADWFVERASSDWSVRAPSWRSEQEALAELEPKRDGPRTYAWVPLGAGWSVFLNDTPRGTDVGLLPERVALSLRCQTVRATCAPEGDLFPARILEVYGPGGQGDDGLIRYLAAALDGRRWFFASEGEPFGFEDLNAYDRRVKAERFTSAMFYDYLRKLGIPIDNTPDWASAVTAHRV